MKSVYISGGSDERLTIVRPMIDRVISAGIEVTYDWSRCPGYDRPSTEVERKWFALCDLDGVRTADVVWILAPVTKSEGSAAELGAALVLGKTVLISGPCARRETRLFNLLATSLYLTHERAALEVLRMCRP